MPENTGGLSTGFAPGTRVAGYLIREQVGSGGMAVVYKAVDARLDRTVALKVLSPALAADRWFRERFVRESRAAAAVDDPHIVPVYEADEADGVLFIAMRYVPGGSVNDLLHHQGPLPPGRVAAIISPVASALDAAHQIGLVHRDVKPANMLINVRPDRPDHVYLSDFGLTKGSQSSVGLTGTNQVLGTPDYMAPEQIEGRNVTGRTDQYALACAAFEMLTGRSPFHREQGMAVLFAHLNQPVPPLSSMRSGLNPVADLVFARALAKAQENRYEGCRQFADALREAFGIAPYRYGSGFSQPANREPIRAAGPHAGYTPTYAVSPATPPRMSAGLTPGAPPRLPAARPYPSPQFFAPYPPHRNRPSAPPNQVRPVRPPRRPSRYPPITRPGWHVAAYLVPILLPFYGMFITSSFLFNRDRSVRMSVILGLEIGAILPAAVVIAAITTPVKQGASASSGILFLFALFAFGLAAACLIQLCMRRQPRIPVLSNVAYRVAYRKTRRP